LRDESLKMLARKYRAVWQAGLVDLLRSLKTPSPEMDAEVIMGTVTNLVYNGLLYAGEIQEDILRSIWSRMIYLLLNLSQFVDAVERRGWRYFSRSPADQCLLQQRLRENRRFFERRACVGKKRFV